jgi:hypothetical protein
MCLSTKMDLGMNSQNTVQKNNPMARRKSLFDEIIEELYRVRDDADSNGGRYNGAVLQSRDRDVHYAINCAIGNINAIKEARYWDLVKKKKKKQKQHNPKTKNDAAKRKS